MRKQKCPLCDSDAEYSRGSYGVENKRFICPDCGRFVVRDSAEKFINEFRSFTETEISEAFNQVENGKVLVIIKAEGDSSGKEGLKFDYQDFSKWFQE